MDIGERDAYIGCDSRFSYIPCVWLYVQQLLFFGFLSEIPPISLLSVHRVISMSDPHKFSRG